jgi:Uma2 family endonuclease
MATAIYMEEQGSLCAWFKNEGDEVKRGDVLAEVDKMDAHGTIVEIYAPDSGVLRRRLVEKGFTGGAETLIAVIAGANEDISAFPGNGDATASGPAFTAPAPSPQRVEPVSGAGAEVAAPPTREAPAEPPSAAAPAPAAPPPVAAPGTGDAGAQAPPPVVPLREPGMQAAGGWSTPGNVPGAEPRSELVDGRAVTPGASSLVHNLIVSNVVGTLFSALRGTGCRVVSQGMPVKLRGETVFLPDVAVFCGAPELETGAREMLLNPTVVVEVLSPESTDFDHGKKWESYRRLPSLCDYLLVWHDQARVESYTRQGAHWLFGEVEGLQEEVRLESIGVTLRLAAIYEGVLAADGPSA